MSIQFQHSYVILVPLLVQTRLKSMYRRLFTSRTSTNMLTSAKLISLTPSWVPDLHTCTASLTSSLGPLNNHLKLALHPKPSVDLEPSIHSFTPPSKCVNHFSHFKTQKSWDFPGGPAAKAQCSHDRGPRFNPGQGTRSCMPQLKIPHATKQREATKTQDCQRNKFLNIYIY